MDPTRYAAAFEAARRYSRSERYDAELATWREALHEAASREDDLPFKAFSDWLEERDLASPETLQRLRSDGAHATPMHFAQHPETGEVVEWEPKHPRRIEDVDDLAARRSLHSFLNVNGGDPINEALHHAVEGPGGIYGVLRHADGSYRVRGFRPSSGALLPGFEVTHPTVEAAVQSANRIAFPTEAS